MCAMYTFLFTYDYTICRHKFVTEARVLSSSVKYKYCFNNYLCPLFIRKTSVCRIIK